ncbi:MAG: hypothetical protein M3Z04_06245 [Chloroflexota bacterium]|nr:hypothetical protein [Chloroflexota bacterium]
MRYFVCLESDTNGASLAHVQGLPGCYARAADERAALEQLLDAIPAYWDWLRGHGVRTPGPNDVGEVTLAVVEIVRDCAPGAQPLFQYETQPISRQSVGVCLERLAYSRHDLLAALAQLPAAALGPESAWGGRLVTQAANERWYTRLLGPSNRLESSRTPLERLVHVREAAVRQIDSLPDAAYGRVWTRGGERWSLHKILRRMIEAEREQVAGLAGGQPVEKAANPVDNCGENVDNCG